MKELLVAFGGAADLVGIILVGFPEIVPYYRRVRASAANAAAATETRIRRLLGVRRTKTVQLNAAVSREAALAIKPIRGDPFSAAADTETRVALLIEVYKLIRADVDRLRKEHRQVAEQFRVEIRSGHADLSERFEARLRSEVDLYLRQRVLGIPLLVAGTVLLSIANFVR